MIEAKAQKLMTPSRALAMHAREMPMCDVDRKELPLLLQI